MANALANTIALVIGGASGIGAATAALLAQNGATVVVADRTTAGVPNAPIEVDVADSAAVDRMVAETLRRHGRIDVLVHCAAILKIVPIIETSDEDWQRVLSVNLDGTFYVSRAVARVMAAQRSGRIVLLTSGRGEGGAPRNAAYAASKGGVNAFMLSLAKELEPDGVLVNAVDPGATDTPLMRSVPDALHSRYGGDQSTAVGKPEDVAETILFLATNTASITGQIVHLRMRA